MKKYLITGGAGFIGGHLQDKLIEHGHRVVIVDNLTTGKEENLNPKAQFHKVDIRDFEKIKPFFKGIDGVFHLAAIPRVPVSIKDPVSTSEVNILGTINVFKASIDAEVKKIVFASSSSIYGNQNRLPLEENMIPNPLSPYGLQKLVGEQFAKLFTKLYGVPIICLRYFNVYGPRIDFNSDYSLVLGKFLRLKLENKPLTIFGNGEQTRGFCFVKDVVDANIKAMENQKLKGGEAINIGQKNSYSINYLAKLLGGEIEYLPEREGDPLHTQADTALANNLLDWSPKVDFKDGVEITKKWFQEKTK